MADPDNSITRMPWLGGNRNAGSHASGRRGTLHELARRHGLETRL
jgi:hypothetical protein